MKNELEQFKEQLLKNTAYRKEIERQDLAFEMAETIIDARIKIGMTQKELARKMKTKQSGIARLESGRHWPNFKSLEKIAKVLNVKMRNPLILEGESVSSCLILFYQVTNSNSVNITTEEYKNNIVGKSQVVINT